MKNGNRETFADRAGRCPSPEVLSSSFDGELQLSDEQKAHVRECPECRAFLESCERLRDAFKYDISADPGAEKTGRRILARVRRAILLESRKRRRLAWIVRWVLLALMALFFLYLTARGR